MKTTESAAAVVHGKYYSLKTSGLMPIWALLQGWVPRLNHASPKPLFSGMPPWALPR